MELLFGLISLVCGILGMILFFKVWGMCNNVARIRELAEAHYFKSNAQPKVEEPSKKKFSVGTKVVILRNGKVTDVTAVYDDGYECAIANEKSSNGLYAADELNKF